MVLWRYVISSYLRIFSLSVATFVWMLLVLRFKEIARFAALNGSWLKTGLFTVYQIPFILPMAIPLSALIAALLLFQKMSQDRELTALRASGISVQKILTPALIAAAFLGLSNFFICMETAPFCRRASKTLFYQETSENPLLLLQRQQLVKLKHTYLQFDVVKEGKRARDFLLIALNANHQRLALMSARALTVRGENLLGHDLALVSYIHSGQSALFDPLFIENQAHMSMAAPLLSTSLKKSRPRLDLASMSGSMLTHRWGAREKTEIFRRADLALAVFSFTFSGIAFGIEQGRIRSRKNLLYALLLNVLILLCYFLGKAFKNQPLLGAALYLGPHPFAWIICGYRIRRFARGHA